MIYENMNRLKNTLLDNIYYVEYNLHEDEKKWICMFINKYPDIINELDTDLLSITEDRHIRIENIPTLIKIIADTYFFVVPKCENSKTEYFFVFITYTIAVILDFEILIMPSNVAKEQLFDIIDSSMALLNMNLIISNNEFYDDEESNCGKIGKKYCDCGCVVQ